MKTLPTKQKPNRFYALCWEYLNSYLFYALETLLACLFVAFRLEFAGLIFFLCLVCVILLICEDIMPTTLPFLLICAMATNFYDSFDLFFPYIIYAPIVVFCVVYHFIAYRKPWQTGDSLKGLFAVSAALVFGGVGRFSFMEYMRGAYYVFGLGFGMIVTYMLMKSQFFVHRDYDFKTKFAVIMTCWGLLCSVMIVCGYVKLHLKLVTALVPYGLSSNNLSTMLMFAMPFPLFLAKKRKPFALLTVLFYVMAVLTTSRGGLIMGGFEFVVCVVVWFKAQTKKARIISACVFAASLILCVALVGETVWDIIDRRIIGVNVFETDSRWKMLWQGFNRFKKNPLSGFGLLDDSMSYGPNRKKGSLTWYHMMIPQVFGSMGLAGVAAYGYQFFGRIKLIFKKKTAWTVVLGLSYLGILAMSQVNPGEFCPLPFQLLTVLLFVFLENEHTTKRPLYVSVSPPRI